MLLILLASGAVTLAAVLFGLHNLALWAEDRGWIYYRNRKGPAPWLGTLEQIYKPEVEFVIEEASAREIRADQDASGADLDP